MAEGVWQFCEEALGAARDSQPFEDASGESAGGQPPALEAAEPPVPKKLSHPFRLILMVSALLFWSCSGTLFEELGSHLAAPIAVAVDAANSRAYVVNSNNNVEFTGASLTILDISSPAAPQLLLSAVNPVSLPNFSGQIYLDPVARRASLTNRQSDNGADTADPLLQVDLDEGSASFGTVTATDMGEDPFGLACCDSAGHGFVVVEGSLIAFDPAHPSNQSSLSLEVALSTGLSSGRSATEVAVSGSQAFVTNRSGIVYVINTPEIGTSAQPIDFVITEAGAPRGVAADGTNLYVVDGTADNPVLHIIPLVNLPPVDPDAALSERTIDSVQGGEITLGANPNEVVVFGGKVYVTNTDDDSVSAIDIASGALERSYAVGDEPFGLAAFTGGDGNNYLYVTNLADDSISLVNLTSGSSSGTFAL